MGYKISKKTGKLYCLKRGECYCAACKPKLHINYFKINPGKLPEGFRFTEDRENIKKININKCGWCKKLYPEYKMFQDFVVDGIYSFDGFICESCMEEIKMDTNLPKEGEF
jgi:hypothetical protein